MNISRATFKGDVTLNNAKVGGQLSMDGSTFEGKVNLIGAKVGGTVDMSCATFKGAVTMASLDLASSLYMQNKANFNGEVNLIGAKVGGTLNMSGSAFEGTVNMDKLGVASSLFMNDEAAFKGDVILRSGRVGGQLAMNGSTFKGAVTMEGLEVVGDLFMSDKATFKGDVNLIGVGVGGQLVMTGTAFEGAVIMEGLEVAGSLFLRDDAHFAESVSLIFATVGSTLDLSGADIGALDLTGAEIAGELRLGSGQHPRTRWRKDGWMILRNAHAGALQDRVDDDGANEKEDAWPAALQLDGFTYDRLGGLAGSGGEADMLARDSGWYVGWLERDSTYSPQPYEQLAGVFRAAGHTAKAHDILYAGRDRARRELARARWLGLGFLSASWWGLSLLKCTIGYGLGVRYFRALWWVAGFTILGAVVHWWGSGQVPKPDIFLLGWLSFDQLLPIAELDKDHAGLIAEGVLERWALAYFYFHKLIGWLLASFLVAGLSGLTQK